MQTNILLLLFSELGGHPGTRSKHGLDKAQGQSAICVSLLSYLWLSSGRAHTQWRVANDSTGANPPPPPLVPPCPRPFLPEPHFRAAAAISQLLATDSLCRD